MRLKGVVAGLLFLVCVIPAARAQDDVQWLHGTWVQSSAFLTNIAEGFTPEACLVFFPHMHTTDCLERWRSLSIEERYRMLRTEGSRLMLGLWERDRMVVYLPLLVQVARERRTGLPYETQMAFFRSYEDRPAAYCAEHNDSKVWDRCLLLIGKMSPDGDADAIRFLWGTIVLKRHTKPQASSQQ